MKKTMRKDEVTFDYSEDDVHYMSRLETVLQFAKIFGGVVAIALLYAIYLKL